MPRLTLDEIILRRAAASGQSARGDSVGPRAVVLRTQRIDRGAPRGVATGAAAGLLAKSGFLHARPG